MTTRVRVLVVDDSPLAREFLTRGLSADPHIEVVGSAADPYEARDKIVRLNPQVLTLDVEMPRMNGIDFLKRLMPQYPIPVVMVSSLTDRGRAATLDALAAGAVDFVCKPTGPDRDAFLEDLRAKVKLAAQARVLPPLPEPRRHLTPTASSWCRLIAIGASTGGTEALAAILAALPAELPPIVVVQHMAPGFTQLFAERLNQRSPQEVREARHGEIMRSGLTVVAPAGLQCQIRKVGAELRIHLEAGPTRTGHCPSVDTLFESVAQVVGENSLGILLTGMGCDGAQGLLRLRRTGARTLAQDEASCVVFGMPRAAWELGAAEKLSPLNDIPREILLAMKARSR